MMMIELHLLIKVKCDEYISLHWKYPLKLCKILLEIDLELALIEI